MTNITDPAREAPTPEQREAELLAKRLRSLAKAVPSLPWAKFSSMYGNDTIAIMKGPRPKDLESAGQRWPEVIGWNGFDSSYLSKTQQHAVARLIVVACNGAITAADAIESLLAENAELRADIKAERELLKIALDRGELLRESALASEARADTLQRALEEIASGEAFRGQRFAEDDDAEYFLRVQRELVTSARSTLAKIAGEVGK